MGTDRRSPSGICMGQGLSEVVCDTRSVRYWVGEKVWFGCTATLDTDAQRRICDFAGFKEDTQIVRTLIDRPDIAFIREVVKKNEKLSFRPLYFVISRFTGFKSVR